MLVKCVEVLSGFAYSFVWRYVYIFCLLILMVDYLDVFMLFIMGVMYDVDVDECVFEGVMVVDLDMGLM